MTTNSNAFQILEEMAVGKREHEIGANPFCSERETQENPPSENPPLATEVSCIQSKCFSR